MRTFVAAVLLAAAPVLAASPVLEDVSVQPGDRPVVTIRLSAPVEFRARTLPANDSAPHRLFLDLTGTALGPKAPRVREGAGAVIRIRTGQFDAATTRVVLDLSGAMPFEVDRDGSTLRVTLAPPAAEAKAPSPAPPPPLAEADIPGPPAPSAEKSEAGPEPRVLAEPEIPAPAPAAPVVAKTEDIPAAPPATQSQPSAPATPPAPVAQPVPVAEAPPPPPAATPEQGPALPPEQPVVAGSDPAPSAAATEPDGRSTARAPLPSMRRPAQSPTAPPLVASRRLVGPPMPEALTRPLTPQDVIVMSGPPATAATGSTTTTVQPAARSKEAPSPTAGVTPGNAPAAAAPAAERPPRPATRISPAAAPKPLVVLDAGHGGRDPGAEGVGGVIEKDVVLQLTRVLAKRMTERLRVNVFLTRTDDSYLTIDRRLEFPSEAVLFVSLHANSCPDPSARGLEIFYGGGVVRPADTTGANPRAALLGKYLNDALDDRVGGVRGSARPGSFSILVRNPLPSALIEIGYLTHPEEAELSQDAVYRDLMADALVDGLEAFLRAAAPPL
jgi:N-acetylmuramoyl-L-alanine amidase